MKNDGRLKSFAESLGDHSVEGISIIRFKDSDIVRHPLVARIVRAYDATYAVDGEEADRHN